YPDAGQKQVLDQLAGLLDTHPSDPAALERFHALMKKLASSEPQDIDVEDSGALSMLDEDPQALAARFAAALETGTFQSAVGGGQGGMTMPSDEGGAAD